MSAPASVVVRMYRNLLGDCFLIRLTDKEGATSYILIDCGLLQGVEGAKKTLNSIAMDIKETTGGVVDLLVITHAHYDHMSGFSLAKDVLLDPEQIRYRQVWMAWTEDPDDKDGTSLRMSLDERKMALARITLALAGTDKLDKLTDDLSKFIGPIDLAPAGLGAAPQGRLTGSMVMGELKKIGDAPPTFLSPGKVVETVGEVTMPVAVLGPPRKLARLVKDLPSPGSGKETYFGEEFLAFSLLGIDPQSGEEQADISSPFSPRYRVDLPAKDAKATAAWAKEPENSPKKWWFDHYFAAQDDGKRGQDYRRIDGDWSASAAALAQKLDDHVNNTSLVLAFKLPDGTFLLFAADAQVGNWLSWHDQPYLVGGETLTAEAILNRTRFYKVGHHGSHNATLKTLGLELMTREDLSAMVSTIEDVAKEQGTKGWQMPDPDVKAALLKQTRGRLIRGDRIWVEDPDVKAFAKDEGFTKSLDESNKLYVELTVYPGPGKTREA